MAVRYLQVEIVVRRCSNWIRGVGQEWECARSWLGKDGDASGIGCGENEGMCQELAEAKKGRRR
ncbi:hypothetical protein DQG13_08575 [Paenibacillus sp. YN15]|nr:hypothetical protein DQG13_08575 [Paenibacillus sp. YN15]